MNQETLSIAWYLIIGFCVVAYTVLDGFDLGVGMLHLFTKKDIDRRVFLNSIGPVWDGNEVWLVVVGGALFAGFPDVYATLFSGFYEICMVFLMGLIFRAVAIEFRSKKTSFRWRYCWDRFFSIASYIIAFGIGVILGNLIEGIPLNEHKDFVGSFSIFFRPYPILVGITTISLLMMHGTIYLVMKTEGELHDRIRKWFGKCLLFFAITFFSTTIATLLYMPFMADRFKAEPFLFILPLIGILCFANVFREFSKGNDGWAFASSCMGIALLVLLFGMGTYPCVVRSSIEPDVNSLTVFNSSSSLLTLKVLLIIVAVGVPLVLAYGCYVYRTFKGKVKIGPTSY